MLGRCLLAAAFLVAPTAATAPTSERGAPPGRSLRGASVFPETPAPAVSTKVAEQNDTLQDIEQNDTVQDPEQSLTPQDDGTEDGGSIVDRDIEQNDTAQDAEHNGTVKDTINRSSSVVADDDMHHNDTASARTVPDLTSAVVVAAGCPWPVCR